MALGYLYVRYSSKQFSTYQPQLNVLNAVGYLAKGWW
jgi:hypothetical protein